MPNDLTEVAASVGTLETGFNGLEVDYDFLEISFDSLVITGDFSVDLSESTPSVNNLTEAPA